MSDRIHLAHLKRRERAEVGIAQTILLFVLPIFLLYFHIIPPQSRFIVLLVFSVLIFAIIRNEGWTYKDIGFSFKTIKPALPAYAVATFAGIVFIVYLANIFHLSPVSPWWARPYFLSMFIFVSVFQEFAYRGFLIPVLGRIFSNRITIILVNAVLFAGMHCIYTFPIVALPFALLGGLVFAALYVRYPNLILVSIMHCILNFTAVAYGFFTIVH